MSPTRGAGCPAGFFVLRLQVEDFQGLPLRIAVSRILHLLFPGQLLFRPGILKARQKFHHLPVHEDVAFSDGLLQDDALQARAARQGHVHLPVGEGAPPHVDDGPFKGLSLALVDRDGKGQPHRILGEGADDFGGQLARPSERTGRSPRCTG